MSVRLLLDENLSERLLVQLEQQFPESTHCRMVDLGGAPDARMWEHARAHGLVLVTKDEDFVTLSVMRGSPPKVVWLNIGNAGNAETAALLLRHANAILAFVDHPDAGFLALATGPRVSS